MGFSPYATYGMDANERTSMSPLTRHVDPIANGTARMPDERTLTSTPLVMEGTPDAVPNREALEAELIKSADPARDLHKRRVRKPSREWVYTYDNPDGALVTVEQERRDPRRVDDYYGLF